MKTLTKNNVIDAIKNIAEMRESELIDYERKVHIAQIDAKAKYFLLEAIDVRYEELKSKSVTSALAEIGDDLSFD
jgi:hypothetical protein